MKKLIWLLPVMAIFLVGCSSTPKIKTVEKVVTKIEIEKKIPLNIAAPEILDLQDVEWVIVTKENIDEVWSTIEAAMFKGIFFSISIFVTTFSTVLILGVEEQPTRNIAITGNNHINFFITNSPDYRDVLDV
jgi:hypothetical protein